MSSDVPTSIWLVECGTFPALPTAITYAGAHEGVMSVPLGFAVALVGDHLVMLDTGFRTTGPALAFLEQWDAQNPRPSNELLPELGFSPADVDVVVLTHAHWDHVGNLSAYPNARFYLQRRELDGWEAVFGGPQRHARLRAGATREDLDELLELARKGALQLVDGSVEGVVPGLRLEPAHETHTFGTQYAVLQAADGPRVIAGDAIYAFGNLGGLDGTEGYVPVGNAIGSQQAIFDSYDRLMDAARGDRYRVIPFHDEQAYERYPSRELVPGLRVAEIARAGGERSRL